ncbi:alpha-1,3/1,6-mannosyltransferase ALG2 [Zychaea mexicana]|uniref:alpha-1,3/1,6-mannosyltransferase ALG2 n=1 Tax=Zychaea mexicana TaxID=64656 RepID=UPI0022FE17C4|nr:alpha-1,3/1,6-mannosyltransferase ALG2 [Zychaea mexicana]KAI9493235.1 alpha-1,3/1,6-mannosyltransferase ALG2 [Zychaea mexicana]
MKIAFIHPDLGIGGAERLVVDAAVGLQSKGHDVVFYTSHHDPKHCFEETRDGTLRVNVRGDWLPRTIFGRFYILCAILRQIVLSLSLIYQDDEKYDVLFIDQLSACIPLFKSLSSARVLFYCHHPDKLLTTRKSPLKKLYRLPVDRLEEWTTDSIVVNSGYTGTVFKESFRSIQQTPQILYPPINFSGYDRSVDLNDESVKILQCPQKMLISINRFERKKNVELALRAFASLKDMVSTEMLAKYRLVLAGGYDRRVQENVEYLKELDQLAQEVFNLKTFTIYPSSLEKPPADVQVVFLCSFNDAQRTFLLSEANLMLYTPSNEHFGIVPVEGMYGSVPVIAVNSGGPVETIKDKETGLLLPSDPVAWGNGIKDIITGKYDRTQMGRQGREHVQQKFSLEAFADQLQGIINDLMDQPFKKSKCVQYFLIASISIAAVLLGALYPSL